MQEFDIDKLISKIFGEREFREYHQGISYGAHEFRYCVNIPPRKKVPLIISSDIRSLYQENESFRT